MEVLNCIYALEEDKIPTGSAFSMQISKVVEEVKNRDFHSIYKQFLFSNKVLDLGYI